MATKLVLKQAAALKMRFQPGATGPAGTIEIGTVTTGAPGSSVVIINTGTPQNAVLDITIPRGDTGLTGDKGWSPILALVADGARFVVQIADWTGGQGTKPASGSYIGPTGLVSNIASAVDIRGPQGPSGSVTDGDKGDIVVSGAGTVWTIDSAYTSALLPKTGGTMTGPITFQDDNEGVTLSRGGRLFDQNTGGTSNAGRTILSANNDSFEVFSEDLTSVILAARKADTAPLFNGNAIWHAGTLNPPLQLINSGTIGAAVASLTVALGSGFTDYEFAISDIAPVTDGSQLFMIVSTDGGASFYNASGNYASGGFTSTSGNSTPTLAAFGTGSGGATTALLMSGAFSNAANAYSQFRVNIATAYTGNNSFISTGSHANSTASQTTYIVNSGILGAAQRITHIRLFFNSGNIAARGKWYLRGVRS